MYIDDEERLRIMGLFRERIAGPDDLGGVLSGLVGTTPGLVTVLDFCNNAPPRETGVVTFGLDFALIAPDDGVVDALIARACEVFCTEVGLLVTLLEMMVTSPLRLEDGVGVLVGVVLPTLVGVLPPTLVGVPPPPGLFDIPLPGLVGVLLPPEAANAARILAF